VEMIDIIQAPFNVLDRRLRDEGLLRRAAEAGKRVFLRSVYLQGLLLMPPDALSPAMAFAAPTVERWRALCAAHGLSPLAAALGFVRAQAPDAWIVVGCESANQIDDNAAAARAEAPPAAFMAAVESLRADDPRLIDPRAWRR
ncbi:MAG: aldo/keto reductase, partial [Rhodospirillales bacterium]